MIPLSLSTGNPKGFEIKKSEITDKIKYILEIIFDHLSNQKYKNMHILSNHNTVNITDKQRVFLAPQPKAEVL